jgi:DNA-binding response OmpR family regulator
VKTILSIDDEPAILSCFEQALKLRGYSMIVTSDPEEGLRIFEREHKRITLAMLDIKMPRKSGFELYNDFRRIQKVPVLFVTAYPKSFDARSDEVTAMWRNEFADGSTDIIYKPFDLSTLFEKVEGLIGAADE